MSPNCGELSGVSGSAGSPNEGIVVIWTSQSKGMCLYIVLVSAYRVVE
jgi:hypothetical protein